MSASSSEVVNKLESANQAGGKATAPGDFDLWLFGKSLLQGMGSLRLTVFLLTLGLVLVLIATLQQTRRDIYQVKQEHFSAPMVFVPFQELLIPAWFPELQDVGGGFLMPSGSAVLIAMLANLFCAHMLRFRVQAKGTRLKTGLLILGVGLVTTLGVIAYGNAQGFQEQPLIPWATQWSVVQWLLLAGSGLAFAAFYFMQSKVRKVFALVAGVLLAILAATVFMLGDNGYIGDDAMRVVWRLAQGTVAALICYVGAAYVFRRKAGIVIIHAGLLLLMVGELYTTYSATEQRMSFYEGETSEHTVNIDKIEFSVMMPPDKDGKQDVVAVPAKKLAKTDGQLDIAQLPFYIKTAAYYPNSNLYRKNRPSTTMPGEKGLAGFFFAESATVVTGTDMDEVNAPAAYVQLIEKTTGDDLGTYLVTLALYRNPDFDLDSITVEDVDYQIGLRYKHYYKPYKVELLETTRENYTGTDLPQSYSSRFRIIDTKNGIDEIKSVHMNRPLRYNNETFYQSGHNIDPDTGRRQSVFQIVQNTGWMIPYVSCAMVGLGLLLHFLAIFVRFVERLIEKRKPEAAYDPISWACVLIFVLVFAMWTGRKIEKPAVATIGETETQIDLTGFSEIPVAFGGRVQPLDSVARSTLRQLRKYEIPVKYDSESNKEVKYLPSAWLADWIFQAPGCDNYRIFKIENPDVISTLDLPRRKSHLFTYAEITAEREEFEKAVSAARKIAERDESLLSLYQKKIIKLNGNLNMVRGLRDAFTGPDGFEQKDDIDKLQLLMSMKEGLNRPQSTPLEEKGKWAVASLDMAPFWIQSLSESVGSRNSKEIAKNMLGEEARKRMFDITMRDELTRQFTQFAPELARQMSPGELASMIESMLAEPESEPTDPVEKEMLAGIERLKTLAGPRVESIAERRLDQMANSVAMALEELAPHENGEFDFADIGEVPAIANMKTAYLAGDDSAFQSAVDEHMQYVGTNQEVADNETRVSMEAFYNRFSPIYLTTSIFIGALILAFLSWMMLVGAGSSESFQAWSNGFRRAAFWLVVFGLAVHTVALVMRIYISGRPPVTNLYSSAVFIGWVAAVLGIISERIVGYSFGTVISSLMGAVCLLVSFSLGADGDTMSVLQAVLDTQFWLSTHVVTITIGYAATFGAGLLGIAYLILSMVVPVDLKDTRKTLAKMVYGVTCLALLFSFVGTVLGGLWADDSWGRFWGWDPKENGALMIVLINAILLHARWAGMVKDRGMAVIAVIGNIVTLWSWFAVNELGVGLHTYGLTEGRMALIAKIWAGHLALAVAACLPSFWWLGERASKEGAAQAKIS